ncbi:MAG: hypothetical protein ABWY58_16010 [Aeromicrobium sp.]
MSIRPEAQLNFGRSRASWSTPGHGLLDPADEWHLEANLMVVDRPCGVGGFFPVDVDGYRAFATATRDALNLALDDLLGEGMPHEPSPNPAAWPST